MFGRVVSVYFHFLWRSIILLFAVGTIAGLLESVLVIQVGSILTPPITFYWMLKDLIIGQIPRHLREAYK